MIEAIRKEALFLMKSIPIILKGWLTLALAIYIRITEFWAEKSILEKVLFLSLAMEVVFSGSGWIAYNIELEEMETVYSNPNSYMVFLILSGISFFFSGFWRSNWVVYINISAQILMGLLLLLAILNPELILAQFEKSSDYAISWRFYPFLAGWVISLGIGIWFLRSENS